MLHHFLVEMADEAGDGGGTEALAQDDECDSGEDEDDADTETRSKEFAEDADTDDDGCQRFQGTHDGGGSAADAVDTNSGKHEREHRGKEGEEEAPAQRRPRGQQLQGLRRVEERVEEDGHATRGEGVEGKLYRREAHMRLIEHHEVDGVGERGNHHQDDTHRGEAHLTAIVEQHEASKSKGKGEDGGERHLLVIHNR